MHEIEIIKNCAHFLAHFTYQIFQQNACKKNSPDCEYDSSMFLNYIIFQRIFCIPKLKLTLTLSSKQFKYSIEKYVLSFNNYLKLSKKNKINSMLIIKIQSTLSTKYKFVLLHSQHIIKHFVHTPHSKFSIHPRYIEEPHRIKFYHHDKNTSRRRYAERRTPKSLELKEQKKK